MNVIPSPCLIEKSSIKVKDAIEIMFKTDTSYILLTNSKGDLSGIFTKTDLIKVTRAIILDGSVMDRGIHLFMSQPVKTLSLNLIHASPEYMLKHRVEHIPITEVDEEQEYEKVIGIVTSESIFEFMVKLRGLPPIFGGETVRRTRKRIGVLGADGSVYRLFHAIYSRSFYVDVERYRFAHFDLEKVADEVDVLLLDIDNIENRVWLPIVKSVLLNPNLETVYLIYSPDLHTDVSGGLKKIEVSGILKLYEKPLDLSTITIGLEKLWAR